MSMLSLCMWEGPWIIQRLCESICTTKEEQLYKLPFPDMEQIARSLSLFLIQFTWGNFPTGVKCHSFIVDIVCASWRLTSWFFTFPQGSNHISCGKPEWIGFRQGFPAEEGNPSGLWSTCEATFWRQLQGYTSLCSHSFLMQSRG